MTFDTGYKYLDDIDLEEIKPNIKVIGTLIGTLTKNL